MITLPTFHKILKKTLGPMGCFVKKKIKRILDQDFIPVPVICYEIRTTNGHDLLLTLIFQDQYKFAIQKPAYPTARVRAGLPISKPEKWFSILKEEDTELIIRTVQEQLVAIIEPSKFNQSYQSFYHLWSAASDSSSI